MQAKNNRKPGYILIVEDDPGTNRLEAEQLESLGKDIRSVYDAAGAVAAIRKEQPELMLLDYKLEADNVNALELLERLRGEGLELPPFLIVTGRGDESVAVETMKAGAQDYLVKDSYFLKNLVPATAKALEKAEMIKELHRTKRTAEAERQKYEELFTFAPVPYLALNASGKIAEANNAWLKNFGYAAEAVEGRWAGDFVDAAKQDLFKSAFASFLKKGSIDGLELTVLTADGRRRSVVFSGRIVKGPDGRFERAQCAFTDVTERIESELRLKTLAHMYDLLARVNRIAARERTADALLREVCAALVTAGEFKMAWAGAVDKENSLVRPLSAAGLTGRYLEDVQAVTGGIATAYGGCSAAVRTSAVTRIDDIAGDPAAAAWREKAAACGCAAATFMPLCHGKKNSYVLAFYSEKPGPLTESELELLAELQDDISLGLDALEAEERRAQAQAALERTSDYLARMLDANPVVLFTLRNDGEAFPCTWISGSAARILGFEAAEILSPGWFAKHLHPDDREAAEAVRARFGRPGRAEADYRFLRKDGSAIWVRAQFTVPKGGGDITGSWTDITCLKESDARFRDLLEALPDGALVHRDGGVLFANRALAGLAGAKDAEALRGSPAADLLAKESRKALADALKKAGTGKRQFRLAVRLRRGAAAAEAEVAGLAAVYAGEPCGVLLFRPKAGR